MDTLWRPRLMVHTCEEPLHRIAEAFTLHTSVRAPRSRRSRPALRHDTSVRRTAMMLNLEALNA